jgi:hypothetical protein
MVSVLVPIWILGGAAVALIILNVVTAGGTSVGAQMDPLRMNPGALDRPVAGVADSRQRIGTVAPGLPAEPEFQVPARGTLRP